VAALKVETQATARGHIVFAALIAASVLICLKRLAALAIYGWNHDSSSHIIVIPIVSIYLIWLARRRIFEVTAFSTVPGITAIVSGGILFWLAGMESLHLPGNAALSLYALAVAIMWTGAFLLCYGGRALRAAAGPLLFLLLMIPIPDPVLDRMIHVLQQGSTEVAYLAFRAVGVPVLRQGFLLTVPGVTIEVAKECSSIRSSMALFITCLLAAQLYLRTWWKAFSFVLLSLPLSVIKNGVRIATLTLLSAYVDPDFLRGHLHRDGGFVFFFLALLILWPVFTFLETSDRHNASSAATARNAIEGI
jgi:exosortase